MRSEIQPPVAAAGGPAQPWRGPGHPTASLLTRAGGRAGRLCWSAWLPLLLCGCTVHVHMFGHYERGWQRPSQTPAQRYGIAPWPGDQTWQPDQNEKDGAGGSGP